MTNANSPADTWNTYGQYRMDKVLHTVIVNNHFEKPLINYEYKPRYGYVKPTKRGITINFTKIMVFQMI